MFAPRALHAALLLALVTIKCLDARQLRSLHAGGVNGGGGGPERLSALPRLPQRSRVLGMPLGTGYGFLAALLWTNDEGAPKLGCGGTLVAPNVSWGCMGMHRLACKCVTKDLSHWTSSLAMCRRC